MTFTPSPADTAALERRIRRRYARWRFVLLLLAFPVAALAGFLGGVWAWNTFAINDGELRRELDSFAVTPGDGIKVALVPAGTREDAASVSRAAVLFVVDVSGSMGDAQRPGDPLYEALSAARYLSGILLNSGVEVGFLAFDHNPQLVVPLGRDGNALREAWKSPGGGGGTDIAAALERGLQHIRETTDGRREIVSRLLILVSDGLEEDAKRIGKINREARDAGVALVGIGIGTTPTREFFDTAFDNPQCPDTVDDPMTRQCLHKRTCCDAEHRRLTEFLAELMVSGDVIGILGEDVRLEEWADVTAFKIRETVSDWEVEAELSPIHVRDGRILFRSFFLPDSPHRYVYHLGADAWGIHPVAVAPAELSYVRREPTGPVPTVLRTSADAPLVLVMPLWLVALLFLPALLYLAASILSRRSLTVSLLPPSELLAPVGPGFPPSPSVRRFRRGTLVPLGRYGEDGLVPTLVLAVGPRAGQSLAALLANRVEAGLPPISDTIEPIYVDCRPLADGMPAFRGIAVPRTAFRQVPAKTNLTRLVEDIDGDPSAHAPVRGWLEIDSLRGRGLDLSAGCGGDRMTARLSLYQDLRMEKPAMHALREDVRAWTELHADGQILVVAAAAEDQGSGMLIDIGFQIRRALGDRVVPTTVLIDLAPDIKFANSGNGAALFEELRLAQGNSGSPFFCMDKVEGRVTDKVEVRLPLFDQVIVPTFRGEAPHPGMIGSYLLDLCDTCVRAKLDTHFADLVPETRSSGERGEALRFWQGEVCTVALPLRQWRRHQALLALNDALQCFAPAGDAPAANTLAHWSEIERLVIPLNLETFAIWRSFGTGRIIDNELSDAGTLRRELLFLCTAYLNGASSIQHPSNPARLAAGRRGRFDYLMATLQAWREIRAPGEVDETKTADDSLCEALDHALDVLQRWRNAVFGRIAEDRPGFMGSLALARDEITALDPSTGGGRVVPDVDPEAFDDKTFYTNLVHPRAIASGELPSRLWWGTDPIGTDFELHLVGERKVTATFEHLRVEAMVDAVEELLWQHWVPEVQQWSLDHWISIDGMDRFVDLISADRLFHFFVFHGFQDAAHAAALEKEIRGEFIDCRVGFHGFIDRLTYLSLKEIAPDVLFRDQSGPRRFLLPAVALSHKLAASSASFGANANVSEFAPAALLLAQSVEIVDDALLLLAGDFVTPEGHSPVLQHYVFRDPESHEARPLTRLGDKSLERAIHQAVLRRSDLSGQPIDLSAARAAWSARGEEDRNSRLERVVKDGFGLGQEQHWRLLLAWKARFDLEQNRETVS